MVSLNGSKAGFVEKTVTVQDGTRIYYRDYGSFLLPGTPVLCLGGLNRNSKDFHPLARRLARERRVLCPDYRGRGRSQYDPDWRGYRFQVLADDVRHLLAAAGVHRVVIIGTSLGGLLAALLGVGAPTLPAGVLVNDIGPRIEPDAVARIVTYLQDTRPLPDLEAAARHMRETFPDLSARNDADWLRIAQATYRQDGDGRLHCDWDPAIVEPFLRENPIPETLRAMFQALGRVPITALRGEKSDLLSAETFALMADDIPGLVRVQVPGVGHTPNLGEPEAREAIDALLARVDAVELKSS